MPNLYQMEELAGMKRSELQKLAKQHGIKANMKTDGLIKALAAVVDTSMEGNQAVSSVQEATTSSASSTEDQSEIETSEEKPKARRGKGRKQKNVKQKKDSPLKAAKADASGDNAGVTTCSEPESENQTSSATEDEKMSPVAKKSKAKPKGRGRGRTGRQTKEGPVEKKIEQMVAPVAVEVSSPAITGRRSRSLQRTPVLDKPTLPTPPTSGSSRNIKRAIRRTTHTPQPAASTQPTPSSNASDAAPSINKRSSRSASKAPLKATPKTTPSVSKTPVVTKTRGSTGKRSASGSAGGKAKKVRRGTFDKSPEKVAAVEVPTKSSSTLKDEIMAEIDRKVQMHVAKSKSSIPTKVQLTKKTPSKKNWSKSHHGALDKMESIDDYLERKQKRAEALSASKKQRIPVITKPVKKGKAFNFASPKSVTKSQTFNFASPKPNKASMPTNPKSAKTVSFKVSKLKTPKKVTLPTSVSAPAVDKRKATPGVRKSISALTPGSGVRKSVGGVRKSVGGVTPGNDRKSFGGTRTPSRKSVGGIGRKSFGATKTPSRKSVGGAVTPFGKSATATSATKPKNVFDLKASLSKPLGYKPHTGKLKPFGETTQNNANVRAPSNLSTAKTLIKKPQLKGRDARRAGNMKHRTQMRNNSFMANRGIAGC